MSKDNVIEFLSEAAKDEQLKEKLKNVSNQEELIGLGKDKGYEFSSDHVEEAIGEMKQKPGFFSILAEAVLAVFSPSKDEYPAVGVQPFSGEPLKGK